MHIPAIYNPNVLTCLVIKKRPSPRERRGKSEIGMNGEVPMETLDTQAMSVPRSTSFDGGVSSGIDLLQDQLSIHLPKFFVFSLGTQYVS